VGSTPDYTILAPPRISSAKFAQILRQGSSPAYPEASTCYSAAVNAGVDPTVLLAVFRKESTYGRFGRAHDNRSWGNLRTSPNYPTVNGFVRYPSWTAGAADAARLLAIYGRNQIRAGKNTSTIQTMPYVWAPASDGNGPDRYGDQLAGWIAEWTGQPGSSAPAPGVGSGHTVAGTDSGAAVAERARKALRDVGVASSPDTYAFSRDDAVKIAERIYGFTGATLQRTNAIAIWQGKTVGDWVAAWLADAGQGLEPGQSRIDVGTFDEVFGAVGDAVRQGAVLLGIVAIIVLALYLIARQGLDL